jgi:hypothetical protein
LNGARGTVYDEESLICAKSTGRQMLGFFDCPFRGVQIV